MSEDPINPTASPDNPVQPPRAFTQGLGQVFQVIGVVLFLAMMSVCCGSSLLSKDFATHTDFTRTGWGGREGAPDYSAQRALTISLFSGVFFGLALAGVGLGLQAEHRNAPWFAVVTTGIGAGFWIVHTIFAAQFGSVLSALIAASLASLFLVLLILSISAFREMRRDPPAPGHEILPGDYKVPYSHYHEDPPEVRLARELEQRRQRLAVQQKELQMLEDRMNKRIEEERRAKGDQ